MAVKLLCALALVALAGTVASRWRRKNDMAPRVRYPWMDVSETCLPWTAATRGFKHPSGPRRDYSGRMLYLMTKSLGFAKIPVAMALAACPSMTPSAVPMNFSPS